MASNGGLWGEQWEAVRRQVLARADSTCHICGEWVDKTLSGRMGRGPVVDHVFPKSRGGAVYDLANCRLAHRTCNSRKRDKVPAFIPGAGPSRDWLGTGT